MAVEANNIKKLAVLEGREARQVITVQTSESIKYIAVSFPGADPTEAVWLCSKQTSAGSDYPFTMKVETYPVGAEPELAVAGVNGAGLAALFGD